MFLEQEEKKFKAIYVQNVIYQKKYCVLIAKEKMMNQDLIVKEILKKKIKKKIKKIMKILKKIIIIIMRKMII